MAIFRSRRHMIFVLSRLVLFGKRVDVMKLTRRNTQLIRRFCLTATSVLIFAVTAKSGDNTFDSFIGLHRGQTEADVKRLFGVPNSSEESPGNEVSMLFAGDRSMWVTVDSTSRRITSIMFPFARQENEPAVILQDEKDWLVKKGIREEKLRFLDMTASVLKKQFPGQLKDGSRGGSPSLVYSASPGTTVDFRLSSSDTYNRVLDIEVRWSK